MSKLERLPEGLHIPLAHIISATRNFQTCIGRGGYGQVYKGELLINGKPTTIAAKRLDGSHGQGSKEFLTEIDLLSQHKHPNLISLLGYCEEGNEKIMVYEYAERGSLDKYINCKNNTTYNLNWKERLQIAVGAARGLDFLHNHVGKYHKIIHRDIKSANILIDQRWEVKISDLGLSKRIFANVNGDSVVISNAVGTPPYCEPEYARTSIMTKKADIYSYGLVLFELLCGRLCIENEEGEWKLSEQKIKSCYNNNKLDDIIHPILRKQMSFESLKTFSSIAYRCLEEDRRQRPTMGEVVEALLKAQELQWKDDLKSRALKELNYDKKFKGLDSNRPLVLSSEKELFNLLDEGILSHNGNSSLEWMELMCQELAKLKAYDAGEGKAMENFIIYANRVVFCLTTKVTVAFECMVNGSSGSLVVCNLALNMLMQILEVKRLALALHESTCEHLTTEFVLWDSDGRVSRIDKGPQLLKTFKELIVKILVDVEQTTAYLLVINLLRPRNMFITSKNQKFSDMIIERFTMHHPTHINDINVDRVLLSIHSYLQEHGMEEIMTRERAKDKSLKMVKMLLCGLSKICRITIKSHLSMIPTSMEPQPMILTYIDIFLKEHMENRERSPCICQEYCNIGRNRAVNTASSSKSFKKIDDVQKRKLIAGKQSSFKCCGCKESGIGQRYECKAERCIGCKGSGLHSFHPDCVFYVDGSTHRFFQGSTFNFFQSPVDAIDRIKICHACGCDINGFSYRCEETFKNLHPSCLNLEETCRIGVIRYQLCEKLTSECFVCNGDEGCTKNHYWGYTSEDDKRQVHVSCLIDWQVKEADDGVEVIDWQVKEADDGDEEKVDETKDGCVIL